MSRGQLAALIVASALVTLDGTATTIALPAIGRELSVPVSRLQWIGNAPLLALTAMLLPAGILADRYGRVRIIRIGVTAFIAGALAAAIAQSDLQIIAARFVQGAGGALVLPGTLAVLRGAYADAAERVRVLGIWAVWTGVASAAGPLLAGVLIDLWSWRTVFIPSAAAGFTALLLLRADAAAASMTRKDPVPAVAALATAVLLGAVAFVLMEIPEGSFRSHIVWPIALSGVAAAVLARGSGRDRLLPRELLTHNCIPANLATFAFYFGMFGLSFVIVLYSQQRLGYSALRSAVVLLPMSMMLFFAERFGRVAALIGTRSIILLSAVFASAGIAWIAAGPHPLPFWSHLIAGTALFGFGLSLAVSALTHAAVAAAPDTCAGAASGLNHAIVRAAGLAAIAILGSVAAPGLSDAVSAEGVRRAMMICALVVGGGGAVAAVLLRDDRPGGLVKTTS